MGRLLLCSHRSCVTTAPPPSCCVLLCPVLCRGGAGRRHRAPGRFYPGNLLFWPTPWNPRPASPLCGDARSRRQSSPFAVRAAPFVGLGRYVEVTRSRGFEMSTPLVELSKSLFPAGHPRPLRRSRRFTVIALLLSASRRCRVFRRSLLRPRRRAASRCVLRSDGALAVVVDGVTQLVPSQCDILPRAANAARVHSSLTFGKHPRKMVIFN